MKYAIEKNIAIPGISGPQKYPFREMKVGDSFIINDYSRLSMQKAGNAARNFAKKAGLNIKFCSRKEGDKIRIFRIK